MNWDQQLELQAWVDGELSAGDARRVAAFAAADGDACLLADELRMSKAFISSNEIEVKIPETREFYWSQVQRRIESAELVRESSPGLSWPFVWRRLVSPLSGLALVAFLAVVSFNTFRGPAIDDSSRFMVEVENLSDDVGSISYRSQSENMFVVYLYKKDQDADSGAQTELVDDSFFQ